MPKELLRIDHAVRWLQTVIRRRDSGVETEITFDDNGRITVVAIGRIPEAEFLHATMDIDCIKILEYNKEERGWTENDRFEICVNYDDDISYASVRGPFVWFESSN